ncbi:cytochrome P450 [Streptomyces roseoverticillatus]|uniref:cytochrome P450 n=1 Tax=Streptomyces roseoverticillatus TaxID=66429 RepID=UPI0012FEF68C|nr:cytochrome P450 [Streptomyces roseoverticillatus]
MPATPPPLPLRYPFALGPMGTPPPVIHWARAHRPVCPVLLPSGARAWMLTRGDDIRSVLADRRFSRRLAFAGAPRVVGEDVTAVPGSLFNLDPPDHTRLRRILAPYYTRSAAAGCRPAIRGLVDEVLDAMVRGPNPCDLMEAFATPLPPRLACALLRVPRSLWEQASAGFAAQMSFADDRADVAAATAAVSDFTRRAVDLRRDDPSRDDPLGALLSAREAGVITEEELYGTASYLLVTGGESLVSPLATGPLTLLLHPDQLLRCVSEPSLWPGAVEEVLRYHHNGVLGLPRIALEDVELHGTLIREGDAVCATMLGATWDPAHYRNPARFNVRRRQNADPTFGAGPHYCLGAAQARTALTVAYRALFERLPGLELAVSRREIAWDTTSMFLRPAALPVVWR